MRIVFDIETDGLLPQATKIWLLVAQDVDTGNEYIFSDYGGHTPLSEVTKFLDNCTELIGHHIVSFDLLALEKILVWKPRKGIKVTDTLIYSQVLKYRRFGFGHSLGAWGQFLNHSKPEHEDWSQWSKEMETRCREDVKINVKVYKHLMAELNSRKRKEHLEIGIRAEHAASAFVGRANYLGWPFDIKRARELHAEMESRLKAIADEIEPKLKLRIKPYDSKGETKSPVYIKSGNYNKFTATWFDVSQESGCQEENWQRPVWGEFCRVEVVKPEIGSQDALRDYLYSIGWEPQEWNYVKDDKGRPIKSSPKLDEDSLSKLGRDGELISTFFSIRARFSILDTWINQDYDFSTGRIYGDCFVIGTPTFRATHKVIANIPSEDATYGPEIRSLFSSFPGIS